MEEPLYHKQHLLFFIANLWAVLKEQTKLTPKETEDLPEMIYKDVLKIIDERAVAPTQQEGLATD